MMNQTNHLSERRQHPRLESSVPVKISCEEFDIVTETRNISRSGAYCRVNKYLEPMTKLNLHLLLPIKRNGNIVTKKVSFSGVIVRVESVPTDDSYNIAIYFNDMTDRGAESLEEFVNTASPVQS